MTKTTELTKADIDALVADFDAKFKNPFLKEEEDNKVAIAKLEGSTADRCYSVIAALMDLALTLDIYTGVVTDAYKQFLLDRSLAPARGTNNPYLPFVKAVFSVQKDGKWVFEEKERKREKYANVLRHLIDAKSNGLLKGTVQDYIRNYNDETYGSKMKGIEAQDRADNPSKGATERVETLRKKGQNAMPIVKIPNSFGITGRKVVVLYGQTNINGEVEVLKADALNDDEADSFYYRLGQSLTPKAA